MLGFTVFCMCKQKNTNMLQNKDIAKIQEIKNLFKDSWTQADFFSDQLNLLIFTKTSKIFAAIKRSGVPV